MEVSHVRNRLRLAQEAARARAEGRRQRAADAERAFAVFLDMATPLVRQLAGALRAEGVAFTLFTPERSLRLAWDRSRDDYIDLSLDTSADPPEVSARVRHARGSRTTDVERRLKPGASPDAITEQETLDFLLDALEPWLE